jgi:hypothetical protein
MRQVIGGDGSDTTAAVAAWLCDRHQYCMANLILIGEPEDPRSVWLTDWESPLVYSAWGTFCPDTVKRGAVNSKIGLEVATLTIDWSPKNPGPITQNLDTANPYQLAQYGLYDNLPVRVWTVYMPTPGDANTFGASALFGGRVSNITTERGTIHLEVTSFLDVVNIDFPTNVIELTNTVAAYKGATPPAGLSVVPQFNILAGSDQTKIIAQCTSPTLNQVFADNIFRAGFVVFNRGFGMTLGGFWSGVYANLRSSSGGVDVNEIVLYTPLPWPPTPGLDTCYVSAAFPVNQSDVSYLGFPYVPSPSSAV